MALLTTEEAGRFLKMHPVTLRNKARAREIPAVRVGGRWRFDESALRDWIACGCPVPVEASPTLRGAPSDLQGPGPPRPDGGRGPVSG